ncbi:MAG: hypothetical protein GKR77_05205 [Legionellales bacterium]|nr:hypothetical protein [Legionellales bacterium]
MKKYMTQLCGVGLLLWCCHISYAGEGGLMLIESSGYLPRHAGGGFAGEPIACQPAFTSALQRLCDDTPQCEFTASMAFCRASLAPVEAVLTVSFQCRYASGDVEQHKNKMLETDEWVSIQCD